MNDVLHIDRLNIKLKGVSPEIARAAASGLGAEIMKHLEKDGFSPRSSSQIKTLNAGQTQAGGNVDQLRTGMAKAIVKAIREGERGE